MLLFCYFIQIFFVSLQGSYKVKVVATVLFNLNFVIL